MFSDPNILEWMSGLILMVFSLGIMVAVSFVIGLTTIRILGDEEIWPQGEERTLNTTTMPEKKRTAA
jgi:hypothetical protein